jgi:hypothetical protein
VLNEEGKMKDGETEEGRMKERRGKGEEKGG